LRLHPTTFLVHRSRLQSTGSGVTTSSPFSPSPSNDNSINEYSFFDEVSIYVRAGSGGQGSSTYKKAKKSQNGIPDGGSGGPGGDVVFKVDPSLNTLVSFNGGGGGTVNDKSASASTPATSTTKRNTRLMSFRADTGHPGGRMYDNGKRGDDCIVRVPPGTVVSIEHDFSIEQQVDSLGEDCFGKERNDFNKTNTGLKELGTLSLDSPYLIVSRGGAGGEGTATLKGKPKGATRRGPKGGERFRLRLTLKMVADIALVGVPNAGKSTFLAAVTRAEPKIANYPFTTVVPNLGVWIPKTSGGDESGKKEQTSCGDKAAGSTGIVLCDVPGLIEGAADGVGLGHAFLRHVERCRVILHLLDGTNDDPVRDYEMVNREIECYGTGSLASKPQVVVVNKIDAWEEQGQEEFERRKTELQKALKDSMNHTRVMWVSAKERQNMDELMLRMASYMKKIKESDNDE